MDGQWDKLTVNNRKYCQLSSTDDGPVYYTEPLIVQRWLNFLSSEFWGKVPDGGTHIFRGTRISLKHRARV